MVFDLTQGNVSTVANPHHLSKQCLQKKKKLWYCTTMFEKKHTKKHVAQLKTEQKIGFTITQCERVYLHKL